MGEDKKYFLIQFHDLENQFKKGLCRNGVLAVLNLNFIKFGGVYHYLFFQIYFWKTAILNEFIAFLT
jgi:hypothetical protein